MDRQIGQVVRYITDRDLRGAIPNGWALEVSQGFYTPIFGDQKSLPACRSPRDACMLIREHLALSDSAQRPYEEHHTFYEQLSLF